MTEPSTVPAYTWRQAGVDRDSLDIIIQASNGRVIAHVKGSASDANLITAAPLLVAALEGLLVETAGDEERCDCDDPACAYEAARTALDGVRGNHD